MINESTPMSERRKYPRADVVTQQRIIQSKSHQEFIKEIGVTKNVSASGLCFRSSQTYEQGALIFVYLDEDVLTDLKINRANILKAGNYFLARIIWSRTSESRTDPFFEIGCAFLERSEGDTESIELFTRLVNHFTAEEMTNT